MTDDTKDKSSADEAAAVTDETVAEAEEAAAEAEETEAAADEAAAEAEETEAAADEAAAEAEETEAEADELAAEADSADETEESDAVAPAAAKAPRAKARNAHIRTEVKDGPGKYAVIETGGKQYRVNVGDRLTIEKLEAESGSDVTFDRVLLLGGDGSTRIGTPVVEGAAVTATVNDHGRGEKIVVFKFKAKKRYRRRTGHRQAQTYITITGING